MDHLDKEARSRNMARIRSKETSPEKIVRRGLHARGFRYKLYVSGLPGKPDLVFPRYRTVLFVQGCFWHQHPGCKRANMPKSRQEYWIPKLSRNIQRFEEVKKELEDLGWHVLVAWECGLKKKQAEATLDEIADEIRSHRKDQESG